MSKLAKIARIILIIVKIALAFITVYISNQYIIWSNGNGWIPTDRYFTFLLFQSVVWVWIAMSVGLQILDMLPPEQDGKARKTSWVAKLLRILGPLAEIIGGGGMLMLNDVSPLGLGPINMVGAKLDSPLAIDVLLISYTIVAGLGIVTILNYFDRPVDKKK
jgi:hypothetical protein